MTFLFAALLGLVQGLTEFIPVSSSAHLKLTKMAFGADDIPLIFDLSCHLGTLIALLWFLKEEVSRLFREDRKKILYIVIALIPLPFTYYILAPLREIASNPHYLGTFLMLTGAMLLFGQKLRVKKKKGLIHDVLIIGAMQSAALIPGISRSASTISTAQVLGWTPKDAVRFSFLLAIPTIIGGNIVEMQALWKNQELAHFLNLHCAIGFFTSLFVGILVIRFAIRYLEKGNMKLFAWYCLTIGLIANALMVLYL